MTRRIDADVIIVGGGLVGASAALALRRAAVRVVLLERDVCGAAASGINFGGVRRQGRPLCQLPLAMRAHRIWANLPRLIGTDGEYVRSGHFKIGRSEADMASLERYRQSTRDFDLALDMLSGSSLRRRAPWLGAEAVGGSLCPEDGHANPRVVAPAFAWAARNRGAHVFEHAPVELPEHDGRQFVVASPVAGIEARAPVLINAAGAWSGPLAERFGESFPLTSGQPAMAVTEPVPQFLPWSLGVEGGGFYCRQVARGNVVMGGGDGYLSAGAGTRVAGSTFLALMGKAARLLPALSGATVIRTWSGYEAYLPDRLPILGFSPSTPGLIHAFGFSGAGFQIAPAVGEVLAELVCDGRSTTPIEAFNANRFSKSQASSCGPVTLGDALAPASALPTTT